MTALSRWKKLSFGKVPISREEGRIYTELNNALVGLCRFLPASVQGSAITFLIRYCKTSFGKSLDFFKFYYPPCWSILYHINSMKKSNGELSPEMNILITIHSMALFLHSLDDHVNDNDIPADHITLLIRSQAWVVLRENLAAYSKDNPCYSEYADELLDDYYSGITSAIKPGNLHEYCSLFRKQMATWLIAPLLLVKSLPEGEGILPAVKEAYESFGMAWRLLDDINDIDDDIVRMNRTSVYYLLPRGEKRLWECVYGDDIEADSFYTKIGQLEYAVQEHGIVDELLGIISKELENSEQIIKEIGLKEMAKQYRRLAAPLRKKISETSEYAGKD